jgi:hypothetical protein
MVWQVGYVSNLQLVVIVMASLALQLVLHALPASCRGCLEPRLSHWSTLSPG